MQGNFVTGAGYFFRGLAMLTEPRLRTFVVFPLLANIGIFLLLGGAAWSLVEGMVHATEEALPSWLGFLTWIVAASAKAPMSWARRCTALRIGVIAPAPFGLRAQRLWCVRHFSMAC